MRTQMTRENKLALVVGFGLILFVGILISDHFSAAQNQEAANLARGPVASHGNNKARNPDIFNIDPRPDPNGLRSGIIAASPAHQELPTGTTGPERAIIDPPVDPDGETEVDRNDEVESDPSGDTENVLNTPNKYKVVNSESDQARPMVAGETTHQVGRGETLFAISKRYYGDGSMWKKLQEFNRDRIPNVDDIRTGVALRIPPKQVLVSGASGSSTPNPGAPSGSFAPYKPSGSPKSSAPIGNPPSGDSSTGRATGTTVKPAPSSATPPVVAGKSETPKKDVKPPAKATKSPAGTEVAQNNKPKTGTYVVKQGDTLAKIAAKTLGSQARWQEIYDMNRDVIRDPHSVKPGTVMKLPAGKVVVAR